MLCKYEMKRRWISVNLTEIQQCITQKLHENAKKRNDVRFLKEYKISFLSDYSHEFGFISYRIAFTCKISDQLSYFLQKKFYSSLHKKIT